MCICLQSILSDSKRQKEIESKMFTILSELIRYAVFMYLVLLMAYARWDHNIFYNNDFVKRHGLTTEDAADAVSTPPDVIDYVEELIDDGLYADNIDGFFNEERAYFLQVPRLRQFRVIPMTCKAPKVARDTVRCVQKLRRSNLDTINHGVGWTAYNTSQLMREWAYERSHGYHEYKGDVYTDALSYFT